MAPHPHDPRLPIWHRGNASQSPGSAAPVASDERDYCAQQTSPGSMPGENGSSGQSTSRRPQPSPQLGRGAPNAGFVNYQQHDISQSLAVSQHTAQRDDVATGATSTRITRSRSAKQKTGPPPFQGDGGMPLSRDDDSDLSYQMPPSTVTSRKGQKATRKRKADTAKSALESVKAPRTANGRSAGKQSLRQTTITSMFNNTQSDASGSKPPKREPSELDSPHSNPPKDKASTDKTPDYSSPGSPDGGGGGDSSEPAADMEPRSNDKPLRSLREIMGRLIDDASQIGLSLYTDSGRQYYIRVGTLCSGTDAPIHVMNLFEMLKNLYGDQVFTTINSFACEIEPYKQGFLMRNSKPALLFKDAKDFAEDYAETADLITGAKAKIPPVDLFIAGTSCVDFSSLNSTKIKDYAGLSHALEEWATLKEKHGDNLSRQHVSNDSWQDAIKAMSEKTERKNTSTKTFAAAMNYAFWRQPMMLIFENVDSAPWQKLIDCGFLQLMGYAATVHRLDTKNYHMPQTRVRKYMIAFSHKAFTLKGAQMLCKLFSQDTLPSLKHTHSNSVTDFILPPNSLELHRARNEMELAAQGVREMESNWSFSKSRHTAFRRNHKIPDRRDWIRWLENAMSNAPANMWKAWENRQPCRVSDLLECIFTLGLFGQGKAHGFYDLRFKAQIIDCSQNVDRITPNIVFGRTGCLTPNAIPVLTLEARPITGTESLRLQGLPVENFDMSVETQAQLQDLAGNAMTTTVVGAVILAALSAVARIDQAHGFNWLENMFEKGDFKPRAKIQNSFHGGGAKITHDPQELIYIKLFAYMVTQGGVRDILALQQRARRRCVCQHGLPYSSIELHICAVCGSSFCKSCKGNPEHALMKSPESLEDLRSLPYAQAEYEFRKFFPPVLWMRSETKALVQKLDRALMASTYSDFQRGELAKAIIEGLCNSTYQLQFVEITDAVRLEYTADSTFILRVVVEKAEIIWYLHLDQFSRAGKNLTGVLTTGQPIARAVLGPEERDQFPGARLWEVWISHTVSFPMQLRVQDKHGLCLEKIGDLGSMPDLSQRSIKSLQGTFWTFHPECGFPENALWVNNNPDQKLFLFKDIDAIGPAEEDVFVISPISREMGRTPEPETRPVLLRIRRADQIHQKFKRVLVEDEPFLVKEGDEFSIQGFIDGWWEKLETHGIHVEAFPNMEFEGVRALAKGAPTSIRRPGDLSQEADYFLCDKYQSLMTTSLPLLGNEEETIKMQETLKTLDLTHQLDLAELTRLIGPLYSAVEMGLVGTGHRVSVIQSNIAFSSDCARCAPRIPEVFYVKAATGSRASGPVVARHRPADQQNYEGNLQAKPALLRIDHNVTAAFDGWRMKKDGVPYVDVRIVAHGHALLQQARAYLPQHPAQYDDSTVTMGSFAMESGVIENPRVVLQPARISAPEPVAEEDARHPSGFQDGLTLFKEQSDSLQWMLHRESLEDLEPFVETEVAEVYHEKLHLRVHADAGRPVYRRGRVVADQVGFGKTAVCLGLIDVQRDTDRGQFLDMRENNKPLDGLVHLHATLVIVPNQLTQQWVNEAKRFLNPKQYNVVMIPTFAAFQKHKVADLKKADIIICSNKVFQDNKYHAEMSRYCSTHGLDKIRTMQKVYRAWYKQFHKTFAQVRKEVMEIVEQDDKTLARQQWASLRRKLDQIRKDERKLDGKEELSFAPPELHPKKSGGKADNDYHPLRLFEMCSFARIIWDEFPYENIPVTEFVANCATMSKWMLSGTPPMDTLEDICKVSYLFNVHVARPLQLIKGRQPPVCENEPLAPHSDLESTSLFQSRHSPRVLVERHEQSLAFVRLFMRKNGREMKVSKIEKPIVLTMSTISFMSHAELELELRSRQYNANNVGAESRRRLMSRVAWKGKGNGHDRSIEALVICASASPDDVLKQSGLTGCSDKDAAKALLRITEEEICGMEDRGRELLAKAFFLGFRLAFITISNTKAEVDGQEDRQLNYYQTLTDIVQSVLRVDISLYQSWDAFESAMRMLIWDEDVREALSKFRSLPQDGLPEVLQSVFDAMLFCKPPVEQPKWPEEDILKREKVRTNFEAKKKFLKIFRDWLTKTPLHSRRWFLFDKVPDLDAAEEELLRLECSEKVPWESHYHASAKGRSHMVVPISELREPSAHLSPDDFDLQHLKALDKSRRDRLGEMSNLSPEQIAAITKELHDYKDTKVFLEEECNRRGLVAKSTDKKETLIARVAADEAGIATDKDYVSPESCGVSLTDFPQEGKKRIRGGNMEVVFDDFMKTVDDQTSVHERSIIAHARRNLQQAVSDTLHGLQVCPDPQCSKKPAAHYVSLLCGHVFCDKPDDGRLCGVRLCQRRVKDVCIPLSKITKKERVIAASGLSGAITQDPDPYLDSATTYQKSTEGPKARAVINLIERIKPSESVVVFVQNAAMEKDIYKELVAADIEHVTSLMLSRNEAGNLEKFKRGEFKVLVQTINSEQAAGSNLHNANHIIFVSPLVSRKQSDWDNHMEQALGRCVRYRQSKTVYVYHMLMDETVEVDTLEWRKKKEIITTDGQAVARFNECEPKDFLARYEEDETATTLQLAPGESRAFSILPRDDVQSLMGDDYLSLASIKALKTIDESMLKKTEKQAEEDVDGGAEYLLEPEVDYDEESLGDTDEDVDAA
ncbi:hypothetical protein INS49_007129 [Diaporthe citri]|uniref:uncharacterized protein n=1 Tax=Diaporthe citri TaxID=83186 RepID=UPI001C7F5229|nr:uncharacterized protein INS49_007129 [Diaporthe citri]KAG6365518.1 hypothetical protein INS49_007129 [Diaporthe citri]